MRSATSSSGGRSPDRENLSLARRCLLAATVAALAAILGSTGAVPPAVGLSLMGLAFLRRRETPALIGRRADALYALALILLASGTLLVIIG